MKIKVQVNLDENLVRKIDEYANCVGVSRSAVCAIWIARGFNIDVLEKNNSSTSEFTASEQ